MTILKVNMPAQIYAKYVLFILLLIPLLLSNSSHANDDKIYPGSMCVKYRGINDSEASTGNLRVSSAATVSNDSIVNTLNVICPIVKDNVNGAPLSILSARIVVIDRHPNQAVTCTLKATNRQNGENSQSTPLTVSTPSNTTGDPLLLNFNTPVSGGTVAQKRHYYFQCSIPPKFADEGSHIVSYQVVEDGNQ